MQVSWPFVPPLRPINGSFQLSLPLRTGIAFCLRVGELIKQRIQRHFLLKQGVKTVQNYHGVLIGLSLDIVTFKGVS